MARSDRRVGSLRLPADGDHATIITHRHDRLSDRSDAGSAWACVEFFDALPRIQGVRDYAALDEKFGGDGYPGWANLGSAH
jgi:long-chain acyl-CoA synthetase